VPQPPDRDARRLHALRHSDAGAKRRSRACLNGTMRSARFIIRPAHSRVARRRRPSVFRTTRQGETPFAISPNCSSGSSATSGCFSRTLIWEPKYLPLGLRRVNPKMNERTPRAPVGLIKQTENQVLRLDLCVPERVGMVRGSAKHVAHRRTIAGRCRLRSRASRGDVAA